MSFQVGVVFFLFQAVGCPGAFFVPCCDVAGRGFAFCAGFCAFEDNDFLCHVNYSLLSENSSSDSSESSSGGAKRGWGGFLILW